MHPQNCEVFTQLLVEAIEELNKPSSYPKTQVIKDSKQLLFCCI